jgi:hypothetical protein
VNSMVAYKIPVNDWRSETSIQKGLNHTCSSGSSYWKSTGISAYRNINTPTGKHGLFFAWYFT